MGRMEQWRVGRKPSCTIPDSLTPAIRPPMRWRYFLLIKTYQYEQTNLPQGLGAESQEAGLILKPICRNPG